MSRSFLSGLIAISIGVLQKAEAQALVTRVYEGNDFGGYYLDPPYWSYHFVRSWHRKSEHWLYRNHRFVFIDIKINYDQAQEAIRRE
jgi:hypothetical protein